MPVIDVFPGDATGTLDNVARSLREFQRDVAAQSRVEDVLGILTAAAVDRIAGAEHAGITLSGPRGLMSQAPTDPLVSVVDALQYRLHSGPCVDAVEGVTARRSDDLRTDERWPEFGPKAYEDAGVVSMLSVELLLEESTVGYSLNLYSGTAAAFGSADESVAVLLATHAALAVAHAAALTKAHNLAIALGNARDIGTAIGVLMTTRKITREPAFELLKLASQHQNRKIVAVAADVLLTGELPDPGRLRS